MNDLSIVIVSYNARADLQRCLDSLRQHPPSMPHDVVVVDNASADGSAAMAERAGVPVIALDRNRGFAAANNVGIRATRGDMVLLLNSDTIVHSGSIDGLVAAFRAHPDAAIAGPRLVNGAGTAELSFGPMLTPWREWQRRRLLRRQMNGDPGAIATIDALTRRQQWPAWVTGACLLTRRADAEAVGLLDERYFMYMEDVDLCAAMRARGRRILFTPAVEIVHVRGRSAASAPAATRTAYEASHLAFYRKHHPAWVPLLRVMRMLTRT